MDILIILAGLALIVRIEYANYRSTATSDFNERGLPPLKINIPMPAIKPPKQNSDGKNI
jgi:hypothetical protein